MIDTVTSPDRRAVLAAGGALCLAPASARASDPGAYEAQLDLAFSRSGPPALAGMVVGRSGTGWIGVRGVRRAGQPDPVTAEDRWHLGSNTKAMTAALWARAVEAGRAEWDMPLARAFPDVAVHERFAGTTVDDLMRHRAGLSDAAVLGPAWLGAARSDARTPTEQRAELAARALAVPPPGRPGAFAYGNLNYMLVGAALERIHGAAWEVLMAEQLFQPLGITTGGFGPPTGEAPWGHLSANGASGALPPGPGADNPAALGPAGTAHMSLADYGRFLAIFLSGGRSWISPASVSRLITAPGGAPPAYALGWGVMPHARAGRDGQPGPILTHDGSNTLWYLSAAVAPERGVAVVAASNDGQRGGDACADLIVRLLRAALD